MSNEIQFGYSLVVQNPSTGGGYYEAKQGALSLTQNAVGASGKCLLASTTPTDLDLSGLTTYGWAYLQNLDAANDVLFGVQGPSISAPTQTAASAGSSGCLAPGTYYYKVTATNSGGETTASNEESATVSAGELSAPSAPVLGQVYGGLLASQTYYVKTTYVNAVGETTASTESSYAVAASYLLTVASPAAEGNATGYNVYAATTTGSEVRQTSTPIAIGTAWTMPTNGLLNTTPSPPAPPGSNTAYTGSITVNWDSVSNATGYNVYRGSTSNGENVLVAAVDGGALTYVDTDVPTPTSVSPPVSNTTTFWAFCKLKAGEVAIVRVAPYATLQVKGVEASLYVNYVVWED